MSDDNLRPLDATGCAVWLAIAVILVLFWVVAIRTLIVRVS